MLKLLALIIIVLGLFILLVPSEVYDNLHDLAIQNNPYNGGDVNGSDEKENNTEISELNNDDAGFRNVFCNEKHF